MKYICSPSAFDWVYNLFTTKYGWKCLFRNFRLIQVSFTWLEFFRKYDPTVCWDIELNSSLTYAYIRLYDAKYSHYRHIMKVNSYCGYKVWQDPQTLTVYKYYNGSIYKI